MCGSCPRRGSQSERCILPRTLGQEVHEHTNMVHLYPCTSSLGTELRLVLFGRPSHHLFPFRDLSAELLQMIPDNHILLAKLCAFYPGSAAEINQLHERVSGLMWTVHEVRWRFEVFRHVWCQWHERFVMTTVSMILCCLSIKCGLPSLDECKVLAEAAMCEGNWFSAVKFHLLSSEPENGLHIGIDYVKGIGSTSVFDWKCHFV